MPKRCEEQSKMFCFNNKPVNNDNNGYLRLVKIDDGHHDIGDFVWISSRTFLILWKIYISMRKSVGGVLTFMYPKTKSGDLLLFFQSLPDLKTSLVCCYLSVFLFIFSYFDILIWLICILDIFLTIYVIYFVKIYNSIKLSLLIVFFILFFVSL